MAQPLTATPLDVLHLTTATNHGRVELGGAELALAELAGGMAAEPGMSVAVAAPSEILARLALDPAVATYELDPFERLGRRTWQILRERRPAVAITHLLRPTLVGQPLAALARVPVRISFLQNSLARTYAAEPPPRWRRSAYSAAFTLLANTVTHATVAVSDRNVEDLLAVNRVPAQRIRLIPNWTAADFNPENRGIWRVRTRAALGLSDADKLIGVVGRLEAQKRQEHVISLLRRLPGVRLAVVGSGSREAHLRSVATDAGVEDRVVFAGFQQQVGEWIAACDVVAVPSAYEGMGRIAAESLAMGVPVVASDVDGLPFVLGNAPAGGAFLVEPDDADGWIRSLRAALEHPPDGARAHALAEYAHSRFGADVCIAAWIELCRELAAGTAARSSGLSWP
jgi:glycosyltransferase involved in cell wall biosynthesis